VIGVGSIIVGALIAAISFVRLVLPIGVMMFSGTAIQANLADKERNLGIPAWRFVERGA
jgi:hypothetical protein